MARYSNKVLILLLLTVAIILPTSNSTVWGHNIKHIRINNHDYMNHLDDVDIDFEDGDLILTSDEYDSEVIISKKYELYIDDKFIPTNDEQKELLKEYYQTTYKLYIEAIKIGKEGIKIGIQGAELGISVIGKLFLLLSSSYDTDDLEEDIEREEEKIEQQAKKLEKKADRLERKAKRLESLAEEMREAIPELEELGWF